MNMHQAHCGSVVALIATLSLLSSSLAPAQTKPATTQAKAPQLPPARPSEAAADVPLPGGMTRIFDGKSLDGWMTEPPDRATQPGSEEISARPAVAWRARNGILESLGAGRGVIYTTKNFATRYRVIFDVRHRGALPGQDHRAGVLVFCTPVKAGEKPVNDALGGIQFQVPFGGSWDYRPGKNNDGLGKKGPQVFTRVARPAFDEREWSRVEILADPTTGVARMAVAQPPGTKAVEVLQFKDQTAAMAGPFALQMHNRGLFDEYANLAVEENVAGDDLVTIR